MEKAKLVLVPVVYNRELMPITLPVLTSTNGLLLLPLSMCTST
ncbi:hypothetical protein MHB42_14525 [Lysinibacillus sp. FSL K6-0232]